MSDIFGTWSEAHSLCIVIGLFDWFVKVCPIWFVYQSVLQNHWNCDFSYIPFVFVSDSLLFIHIMILYIKVRTLMYWLCLLDYNPWNGVLPDPTRTSIGASKHSFVAFRLFRYLQLEILLLWPSWSAALQYIHNSKSLGLISEVPLDSTNKSIRAFEALKVQFLQKPKSFSNLNFCH